MNSLNPIFKISVAALCLACAAPAASESLATIKYLDDPQYSDIKQTMQQDGVLDQGVEFINSSFNLERDIAITIGADDGPLYDPQVSEIQIPYFFYTEVIDRFSEIEDDEQQQATFASDAMLHTLFHELGHALVDQLELPIVGKEEDAVDALANVILLEYFDDGAEMAGNAAELFALESEDRDELDEEDFWDEHSLDEQRYFSTLCHIFGSDPDKFTDMAEDIGFDDDRREICIETYERLVNDWGVLLEPSLKNP